MSALFDNELSSRVWNNKYRYAPAGGAAETTIQETWRRVARAVASVENSGRSDHEEEFLAILDGFRFLPAGRILAAAGTSLNATLFNCFVMGRIDDSIPGIFERLRESALTMQLGGGIGCDFSTLRPGGSRAAASGRTASGPVSFMRLWNAMCTTLLSRGNRRGAMMGVLRCDHPDILDFIEAKRTGSDLTNFNLSVGVTDELLRALDDGSDWPLAFPADGGVEAGETVMRRWPGTDAPIACAVHATLPASQIWQAIVGAAYDAAEPGVLFLDRINDVNNLYYRELITATNPCGEVPLPPFGACNLGSVNVAAFVEAPYSPRAAIDIEAIGRVAHVAARFLDNVIDLSPFPLEAQAAEARGTRRIGLGITGLGDALIMLGLPYDSEAGRAVAVDVMQRIRDEAYRASIELAGERGSFPYFERDAYLGGRYVATLPDEIRDGIARGGIRNSHSLAIAPAGSISVLANNVSSGIEPVFAAESDRIMIGRDGMRHSHRAVDHAYAIWKSRAQGTGLPKAYITAHEISPEGHLLMSAALQPLVDNSISKTVNVAEDISREEFSGIYRRAFALGLKGCTVFRANPVTGAILSERPAPDAVHCCVPEREGD